MVSFNCDGYFCSYYNYDGKLIFRRMGNVCAAKPDRDDRLTLERCRFRPGNHLCVVIRERENEQRYSSAV